MKKMETWLTAIAITLSLSLSACGGGGGGGGGGDDVTSPGITVSPTTLTTSEDGTEASFAVALNTQPSSDVEIDFESQDTSEGEIKSDSGSYWDYFGTSASLTFTPDNWNVPQSIQVRGVDDSVADGNQTYKVAVTDVWSMDLNYLNVSLPSVSVTNTDTDVKAINVSTTTLSTNEGDSYGKYVYVSLSLTPDGDVEVPITITDASEGSFSSSSIVTEKTLTFTSTSSQYVYVYGVDDDMADGNQTYDITIGPAVSAADTEYDGLSGDTISVTNSDDDTAGYTLSTDTLQTYEWDGGDATFTVVLNTPPTEDVIIPVTSPDATEGLVSSGGTAPGTSTSLTFTSANWDIPQTVTVTGENDDALDGDQSYDITVGAPTGASEYASLSAKTVSVVNVDDDTAKVNIQGSDLQTSEAGGTDTFVVSLAKEPVGEVVINVTSGDITEGLVKGGDSLVAVETITLSFDATNWKTSRTVTVVGDDDLEIDGNQAYTVSVAVDTSLTNDTDYAALSGQTVSVTNADDDVAGMTVTSGTLYVSESGGTDSFTVQLNTIPTADVTVPVSVDDSSEILIESGASGEVATLNLTFTSVDWSTPQTVTVHAVDDFLDEYYYEYFVATVGPATSADVNYNDLSEITRTVDVSDNDTAGFVVTPSTGLTTSESGTSDSFTVELATEPYATAFINVSSGNTAEGLLTAGDVVTPSSAVQLEFTPDNWQTAQTVTVEGQNDAVLDGPITFDVTVDDISGYDASAKTATVTNSDDEVGVSENQTLSISQLPYDGQVGPAETSTYSMVLSAGWKYTVTASNITDDISLEVQDSGAVALCSSAVSGAKEEESCAFTTPADGSVSIIIDGAGTENGAGFTLSLSEPVMTTTFQTYGEDGRDMYLYDADILSNPSEYALRSVYDWGLGGGSITYDLVAGQSYYLRVEGYYSYVVGAYKVLVTEGAMSLSDYGTETTDTAGESGDDNPSGASALTLDTPLERYMSDSDTDWFVYTAPMP